MICSICVGYFIIDLNIIEQDESIGDYDLLKKLFYKLDKNRDGVWTYDEFETYLEKLVGL